MVENARGVEKWTGQSVSAEEDVCTLLFCASVKRQAGAEGYALGFVGGLMQVAGSVA